MKTQEENFLTILKDTLHPNLQLSSLVAPDWSEILSISAKQNLLTFTYNSAAQYDTFSEYDEFRPDMFIKATSVMSRQIQKTDAFLDLYRAFIEAGEPPIVLKGIVCRSLYKDGQDFRVSGDEDLLVSKKNYSSAVKTLNRCGYTTDDEPDENLELTQEVTFKNPKSQLTIELHLNPFGTDDNIRTNMNEWFKNVFDSKETVIVDGVPVRTLEPTDHMLFLTFHAFKHFIYGGFGIRLMLDILLFAEKYDSRIDWNYIEKGLDAVGTIAFYNDLVSLGNQYLGFDLSLFGNTNTPDELLEDMFRMGTFGNTTTADHAAAMFTADAVQRGSSRNQSKLRMVFQRLFPSWQTWKSWYPYLRDKPLIVIPKWFKRLGRYLRHEMPMGNMSEINESYEIAKRRLELLKKYKVL